MLVEQNTRPTLLLLLLPPLLVVVLVATKKKRGSKKNCDVAFCNVARIYNLLFLEIIINKGVH